MLGYYKLGDEMGGIVLMSEMVRECIFGLIYGVERLLSRMFFLVSFICQLIGKLNN